MVPGFVAQADEKLSVMEGDIPTNTNDGKAGGMEGYLPTNGLKQGIQITAEVSIPADGTMKQGVQIRPALSESFVKDHVQKFIENLQKLPQEQREEYVKNFAWDKQPAYNADIWPNKADYDKMVEEWRKQIQASAIMAVGLQSLGNGVWRILSATADSKTKQSVPLTISALRYDANRNVWISNNGELSAKSYTATEDSLYGAQTGTEWTLEKTDSLTHMREVVRVTKTTDGKRVYMIYAFNEQSVATGQNIAKGGYLLMFPVQTAGAKLGTPGQR